MNYAIVNADGSIAWGQWFSSREDAEKLLEQQRSEGHVWTEGCFVAGPGSNHEAVNRAVVGED